ncbi:DUF7226 domain-containing protein [Chloroflexus sp.]|uniref:DUF7226 domain-containing protein n=1 Tax=Chloroflexus sp. TaxID=1904827 RepID=UPI00261FB977|nr:AAA-associated domain-containing protein [uncultured Chloroflexus sp.]
MLTTADIPQADVIWDVARVPEAITRGRMTAEEIGEYIGAKGQRQGLYYMQAARIIGLIELSEQTDSARLTKFGLAFTRYNRADQRAALRRQLLRYEPTKSVIAALRAAPEGLERRDIARILQQLAPLAVSTAMRRAATITSWLTEIGLAYWHDDRIYYCGPELPLPVTPPQPPRNSMQFITGA